MEKYRPDSGRDESLFAGGKTAPQEHGVKDLFHLEGSLFRHSTGCRGC